ncbi:MAG: beta-ketoacyl-ACP synthase II [Chloroflexi bacterium]|nr:beta-ketoacyl-ACP synthase II [Chloroflexota bacterium]
MSRRVVVTGLGIISPLGHTVESTWAAIKAGQSGVDYITQFDIEDSLVKVAGEVKNWVATDHLPTKEVRRTSRFQQFLIAASHEALAQSGLEVTDENRWRTSVVLASSVGGLEDFYYQTRDIFEHGDVRRITPFGIPMVIVNGASNRVSIEIGAMGPSHTPIAACATGSECIGMAYEMIRSGRVDQVVAGAGEAPIFPVGVAAFDRVGAVSRVTGDVQRASRPFDKDRTGLVFAEGAGVLVLELLETAQARGAEILAELVGYGATSDAFHLTAPHPNGIGAREAIRQSLHSAQLDPTAIDYICAHGTATALNDVMETHAVKEAFGEHAYAIPISSTKSMTGHGMGATAAIEAAFSILALRDQVVPPTINLETPDPDCDLDYVPNEARALPLRYIMTNAFGFGGHNSSLIFKMFDN